jgi:hypothetical protein
VTLGAPFLESLWLEYQPVEKRFCFRAKGSMTELAGQRYSRVELTRDLTNDWAMVPVRFRQGESNLATTALLALQARESSASTTEFERANFAPLSTLVSDWTQPGAHFEEVAFSPEARAGPGVLRAMATPTKASFRAVIGADVWSKFHFVLDLANNALFLQFSQPPTGGEAHVEEFPNVLERASEKLKQINAEAMRVERERNREPDDP